MSGTRTTQADGSLFHDPELIASARGIADEFQQVGKEQRTQEVLRTLADRYERMDALIAQLDTTGSQLGAVVLECIKAGHVKVAMSE
jgi:hypothetical protein